MNNLTDVVETAVPQVRVARLGAKGVLYGIAAILAVAALSWLIWALVIRPRNDAVKVATAQAGAVVSDKQAEAVSDAQRVVIDVMNHTSAIDAQTRSNHDRIVNAPGASQTVPPAVAIAGRRSLCLRPTYLGNPACAAFLPDIDSGGVDAAGAGSTPAG